MGWWGCGRKWCEGIMGGWGWGWTCKGIAYSLIIVIWFFNDRISASRSNSEHLLKYFTWMVNWLKDCGFQFLVVEILNLVVLLWILYHMCIKFSAVIILFYHFKWSNDFVSHIYICFSEVNFGWYYSTVKMLDLVFLSGFLFIYFFPCGVKLMHLGCIVYIVEYVDTKKYGFQDNITDIVLNIESENGSWF